MKLCRTSSSFHIMKCTTEIKNVGHYLHGRQSIASVHWERPAELKRQYLKVKKKGDIKNGVLLFHEKP